MNNYIKNNIEKIRADFPVLTQTINGKPLVYLDNAATTQKPKVVIDTLSDYYYRYNANIHRGVYYISQKSTDEYEKVRTIIKNFINAKYDEEIIFTKGATESLNLLAYSLGKTYLKEGDEVIISHMEHHANIVPWQELEKYNKIKLKVIPVDDNGDLISEEFEKLITEKTKILSLVHISNSLGTINPIEKYIEIAHKNGIKVIIDASQSIQHYKIDVQLLDCDFLVFSGHKIYGPTGTGVVYGKKQYLTEMVPYQTGGDMILSVSFDGTIFNDLPNKFEAGTPNIEGIIGLGKAIEYFSQFNINDIQEYEKELLDYATAEISKLPDIRIIGTSKNKASVLSFYSELAHPHDLGTLLDEQNVCVRAGHHCTQPVMRRFGIPATARASFAFYNTFEEIDIFINAVKNAIKLFS
ncbi:MAG TPA: cysteine desulfurase [Ignavibacteriales bacterium]|nr:cysteine desulfurase [Ignavibacteriales bacterium]HOL80588.1 cysteine desulfurase [Ignavibacteriales bacterium]HOM64278.1 cysteine desulfurase [Ignavibacteriales bacterium]HPD68447.1 cysteine desulfurase [Ignavibacteriales bacterium]HPP33076.1 cysteine desulfurase [Ignavibacteriales bacterium]